MFNDFGGLFSPLDKKYCMYFYFLSVFAFGFMLFSLINLIFLLGDYRKNKYIVNQTLSSVVMLGIAYFSNRLLYTMCVR
jgi:hypothetical protein